MLIAYTAAAVFLALAALLLFAWPLVWAMPHQRLAVLKGPEMRFVSGCMTLVVGAAAMAPIFMDGFDDSHTTLTYLVNEAQNFNFRI